MRKPVQIEIVDTNDKFYDGSKRDYVISVTVMKPKFIAILQ